MFSFHTAYNVTVALFVAVRLVTVSPAEYVAVVAVGFVLHPINVYPVLCGIVDGNATVVSYLADIALVGTPVTSFAAALNLIVYEIGSHV